jgi:predicted acylesterase/phospholipase RssA
MNKASRKLEKELANATDFAQWREAALALDELEGLDHWRQQRKSDLYDYRLIASRVSLLRKIRNQQDHDRLVFRLREELHGNLGNMANPVLYQRARVGTKILIDQYLDEVTGALDEMCDSDVKTLPPDRKRRFFKRAARSFGRSALLLSGGASLGLFHLGVIRELNEQNLLPRIITGSSAGAIIGAILATHTNQELGAILEPGGLDYEWCRMLGVGEMMSGGSVFDPDLLRRSIDRSMPNLTFLQAYQLTGRILNISVSPADLHQFPRLLNYLTAPNVLVRRAALASSAIPGLYPPVQLRARNFDGKSVGYMPQNRWIDGSVHGDIPKEKVNRLHNVNHYIVSQTNPHIVPFLSEEIEETGIFPFLQDVIIKTPMVQIEHLLELVHRHFDFPGLGSVIKKAHAVVSQSYSGDITVYPAQHLFNLGKVFSNAEPDQAVALINEGRRATWPKIERIRNTTRISRTFDVCIRRLGERYRYVERPRIDSGVT